MRKGMIYRSFIYFLSISFLLCVNGFPRMVVEAREVNLPVGELLSRGDVRFEARENVWKEVETSHFPVFEGVKIKTEKGAAVIALVNTGQIEVGPNSLFYFDQMDQFILSQGNIQFLIPSGSEVNFKVGNLSISKSRTLQASKDPRSASQRSEETIGTIHIHSNGSVTVSAIQGKLSILNQDRIILAALSSKDSVTVPSVTVGGKPRMMVARAGKTAEGSEAGEFLGLSTWTWVGIGLGVVAAGAVGYAVGRQHEEKEYVAICP